MKKSFIIMGLLLPLLIACNSDDDIQKAVIKSARETANSEINISYTVFSSSNAKINESCEVLNAEIKTKIQDLEDSLQNQTEEMFSSMEENDIERPQWKSELHLNDTVFMATDKYISVRLTAYTYAGGAHGMTQFYSYNYDVKNHKLLMNNEIFDTSMHGEIDNALKEHFHNPSDCLNETPTFDKVSAVNISPDNICFTYEHYVLGAYACGSYESVIPKKELSKAVILKDL